VAVFGGGLIGTGSRFALAEAIASLGYSALWGTLAVNLGGAFLLGFAVGRRLARTRPGTLLVPFLGIGLLGSFTTFSGFSYEVADLLDAGRWQLGLLYAVGSIAFGLLLAQLGERLGGRR
jgi:CrcB protein